MNTPTRKQMVVQSLKALHKERLSVKFRLKALGARRQAIDHEVDTQEGKLRAIEDKLLWEVNTHSDTLKDRA